MRGSRTRGRSAAALFWMMGLLEGKAAGDGMEGRNVWQLFGNFVFRMGEVDREENVVGKEG